MTCRASYRTKFAVFGIQVTWLNLAATHALLEVPPGVHLQDVLEVPRVHLKNAAGAVLVHDHMRQGICLRNNTGIELFLVFDEDGTPPTTYCRL